MEFWRFIKKKDRVESIVFNPIPRLQKYDALYYKVQAFHEIKSSRPVLSRFNLKSISSASPDQFPKTTRVPDCGRLFSSEQSDSESNDSQAPIQPARSIRFNASNFRPCPVGRTISFNTGAQYRKSLGAISPKLNGNLLKFNCNGKISDNSGSVKVSATQVRLPFLSQKASI